MKTTQSERIEKMMDMSKDDAVKLMFQWIKTGNINLREFRELHNLNENRLAYCYANMG